MADETRPGLLARLLTETWPAKAAGGILESLMLPGQVAGGILNVKPERPGVWSDIDEAKQQATYNTMTDRAAGLGGLMMLGSTAAPAVRNAVGSGVRTTLPMDETSRMGRAAEQGYTVDAYKGMYPYDYNTVPSKNFRGDVIPDTAHLVPQEIKSINTPGRPYAGFFSSDHGVANRFAELFGESPGSAGAVMPAKLKFQNPVVIDAQGKPAAAFQFESVARQHNSIDDYQKFQNAFGGKTDGVILKNTKDEGTVYVPRNPDQIRSRFAEFDPKNVGSGAALGGLAALLLGPQDSR